MRPALHNVINIRDVVAPNEAGQPASGLREAVSRSVRRYLSDLGSHSCTDLYRVVVSEIEAPLLDEVLAHCRGG